MARHSSTIAKVKETITILDNAIEALKTDYEALLLFKDKYGPVVEKLEKTFSPSETITTPTGESQTKQKRKKKGVPKNDNNKSNTEQKRMDSKTTQGQDTGIQH